MTVYFALLVAGVASGFLAGLLGIGGGFIMVPVLILMLPALGIGPDLVPKVAVATSLAAMIPTACSAVFAQVRCGGLDTVWVRRLAPAAVIGAAVGSQLAIAASGRVVAIIFAIYAGCVAARMLRGGAVDLDTTGPVNAVGVLPPPGVGAQIGLFASIAGVGGASLTVPFLLSARVEMKRALAVSSAVGLAIAVAGGAGFASAPGDYLSTGSSELIGFVHWPAALMIAVSAAFFAPRGVSVSHALSAVHLKRAFSAVLIAACAISIGKVANINDGLDYIPVSTVGVLADR